MKNLDDDDDDDDWKKTRLYTNIKDCTNVDGIEEIGKEACYQFCFTFLGGE